MRCSDNATSTSSLIRVVVVDEQLAIFAVPSGLAICNANHSKYRLALVEDGVHLFQRAVGGFRVEKVNHGKDKSVAELHCQKRL